MPADPAPIRGRWTLRGGETFNAVGQRHITAYGPEINAGEWVEVVPVPDEAAIERGAKAYAEQEGNVWDEFEAEEHRDWYRRAAEAVLRAALEPQDDQ